MDRARGEEIGRQIVRAANLPVNAKAPMNAGAIAGGYRKAGFCAYDLRLSGIVLASTSGSRH
jgi:hypothetical protein